METKRSTTRYWIYFFIWAALLIIMLALPDLRPYFWLALPGTVTYFSLAMNIM